MCLFCDLSSTAVKDSALSYFIYDIHPAAAGHALIIPKRHIETVFSATPEEWASMGAMLNTAKAEIEKNHAPSGYNIKINCGESAGQVIPHAHIHLIPKYPNQ